MDPQFTVHLLQGIISYRKGQTKKKKPSYGLGPLFFAHPFEGGEGTTTMFSSTIRRTYSSPKKERRGKGGKYFNVELKNT